MDQFVLRLKYAATNLADDKLDVSCCSFIQFEKCIVTRMKNETKCSKEDVEIFQTLVHGVGSEVMDFVCLEYISNPSKCDELNTKLENEQVEESEINEDKLKMKEGKSKMNEDESEMNENKSKMNEKKLKIKEENLEFTGKSIMLPLIEVIKNIA